MRHTVSTSARQKNVKYICDPFFRVLSHAVVFSFLMALPAMANAQQPDKKNKDGIPRFEELTIERVSPEDLADGVTIEDPTRVIKRPTKLPRPPSDTELAETRARVSKYVVEVVAIHMPPRPYRQVPRIFRGHGVWITPPGANTPVLITTLDWLEGARELYMLPAGESGPDTRKRSRLPATTDTYKLDAMTAGYEAKNFEKHKRKYKPVKLVVGDRHRNLAMLSAPSEHTPSTGLELFDVENEALSTVYGYSPQRPEQLTAAAILPSQPQEEALSYYFQTSYVGILGAPLLSRDGRVVVINAIHHPEDATRSLAIPPGSLRYFLKKQTEEKK
jgi:hypothetical protein